MTLELPNNHLGNFGTKALAQLSRLERLDLTDNHITATGAASIGIITTLRHLNLSNNAIEDEGCGHLSSLSSLTSLNISQNTVTSVGLHCLTPLTPTLQELVIDDNDIYEDEDAVLDLSSMTCLTSLSWAGGSHINTQQLSSLTQLRKLLLSKHELFQGVTPALAGLAALTQLTSLNLEGLDLDERPDELRCISSLTSLLELTFCFSLDEELLEALTLLTRLTKLEVLYDGYYVCDTAAIYLAPLTNIRHLELPLLDLEDDAAAVHITNLRQNLTFLDVSVYEWEEKDSDDENDRITSAAAVLQLGNLSNLLELSINGRRMGDAAAAELTRLTKLTKLKLGGNHLGDVGAEHVASLLGLQHLDIGSNDLTAVGAAQVARLPGLTFLDITFNQLGDEGAAELAMLPSIVALTVEECELGGDGAAALTQLSKLTFLEANYNNFEAEGVDAFSALTKLQYLGIYECGASYKDAVCLALSLPQLRKLQYFGDSADANSSNKLYDPANAKAAKLLGKVVLDVC